MSAEERGTAAPEGTADTYNSTRQVTTRSHLVREVNRLHTLPTRRHWWWHWLEQQRRGGDAA